MRTKTKIIFTTCLIFCFFLLTWAVSAHNPSILKLDHFIFQKIVSLSIPWLTASMLALTHLCDPIGSGILFSIFCIFFLIKKSRRELYIFILALGLTFFITEIIKYTVMRSRPISPFLVEADPSFPSSHAGVSTVFLFSTIFLVVPLIKTRFFRNILLIIASIVFPLVAVSRIYLSIHWTSDVVAGALLGSLCFLVAGLLLQFHNHVYPLPKN